MPEDKLLTPMRILSRLSLAFVAILLSACVYADGNHIASLGGKGTYKSKAFALVFDHQDSFRAGAAAAGLAIGAAQAVSVTHSNNALTGLQNTNQTKQAINDSNNGVLINTSNNELKKATTLPK